MRTVELLDQVTALAGRMGYRFRYEALAGTSGGVCKYGGHQWIFVDLDSNPEERLELVTKVLKADPSLPVAELGEPLASHFGLNHRRAA